MATDIGFETRNQYLLVVLWLNNSYWIICERLGRFFHVKNFPLTNFSENRQVQK